jgi:hypothetical protein
MFGVETSVASIPSPAPRAAERRLPAAPAERHVAPSAPGAPICPHRIARWAWGEGLRATETVALLVQDLGQAEAMRLGLSRLGLRVVCLDGCRSGEALAETLGRSEARLVVVDTALAETYAGVLGRLASYPALWWNGPGADFASLDHALAELA